MKKHWAQLPPGPNVGKTVKLAGITRHGKNRIHEKGDMWKVTGETDKASASPYNIIQRKTCGKKKIFGATDSALEISLR